MKQTKIFDTAVVTLPTGPVMVVAVNGISLDDERALDAISRAFERASGHAVVLLLKEPCGCASLIGDRAHVLFVSRTPPHQVIWQRVSIDLASPRPVLRQRPLPVRRLTAN